MTSQQASDRVLPGRSSDTSAWRRWLASGLCAALLTGSAAAAAPVNVKMATLSPEGSPWDKILKDMGKEWETGTAGRVTLTVYPGGVAGDEPDILRKLRIGQYQGGALSVAGLADIDESFTVFEVPLFFRSYEELLHVLDALTPTLEQRLDQKGFVLLGWGYVGWVYFFTTKRAETVDDMRQLKIFTWAGDEMLMQWWRRNGFKPVSLAATDIMTGLQTGMIEAMSVPPLYAMQMQFHKLARYMADIGLAPMIGAILVNKATFQRLTPADQQLLRTSGKAAGQRVLRDIPKLDRTAIQLMAGAGLEVVKIEGTPASQAWVKAAESFATDMRGDIVPIEIFDEAVAARAKFRSAGAPTSGGNR